MLFFSIVLFAILVIGFQIGVLIHLSTILLGVLVLVLGNLACRAELKKFASVWWDALTMLVTGISTGLLWYDIWSASADYGAAPFMLLLGYSGVCGLVFAIHALRQRNRDRSG